MKINIQIEIDAPAEVVFAYIADLSNNPDWQSGVEETKWESEGPVAVGSKCEQRLENGGVIGYIVTAIDPDRSIAIRTEYGAVVKATVTRTVQKLNDSRSRVKMELIGRVGGWRWLITPLMKRLVASGITSDYRRLKRTLEPDADADG